MARDVTAVTSNLMLSHETSAETLLSALQKGLLISRQSLAPKRFVRGDEEGDESCEKTRCIARGEMNPAMVGFRMTGECTGFGPFNKGAFHLALALDAPVQPLVFFIPSGMNPGRGYGIRPGTMYVHVMPSIDTAAWRVEDLVAITDDVRDRFVAWHHDIQEAHRVDSTDVRFARDAALAR
jgi:1-acyl-sn-glycerol-3-phosphate acyltransferase